jgi:ribosomal-protein-alanine acetyltransferase
MSFSLIKIRKMADPDVLAITNLESTCFKHPWPEKEIRYELHDNPIAQTLVAENSEGQILGYLDFMITFDSATINRLAVAPASRNKGIAQSLLDEMVKICQKQETSVEWITLEVRSSNEAAKKLYLKNGWSVITVKKGYYDDGEDAIYMVRSIIL